MRIAPLGTAVVLASSLVLLAACGSDDAAGAPSAEGGVSVVASTDVYGDIAATIAGDDAEVTSIIDDPSADPHSYEASARTQLAVSAADLVLENGGGYDDFMDTLVSAADSGARVIDVVELSGRAEEAEAAGEELNEHVWYDFPAIEALAGEIVAALGEIDPDHADAYAARGADFLADVHGLRTRVAEARPYTAGAGVAVTEPVPGYLLDALGADNRTPAEFSQAIEEGDGVAPSVLRNTVDLFAEGKVAALVYNEQTTGAETRQVLDAAAAAGVAVVPVTETLPDGKDYISWMQDTVDAVAGALTPRR